MTKVNKRRRRIAIIIPKRSIKKIKKGELKELEKDEEVMLYDVEEEN